ncbi:MAG: LppC family lipoprotein [Burkholderiales bacterium]|nr:LppC family lipoprotein [Burkholderiales bacterium]
MRCGVLHRWLLSWSVTALLYGGAAAFASEAQPAITAPAAPGGLPAARPLEPAVPHIALLMPASSGALGRAADAVQRGFMAAAKIQGSTPLPVRVYTAAEHPESAVLEYRRAMTNGARLVVGPLTRDAVTSLASSGRIVVPTLALNVPDGEYPLPPNFYILSLHMEAEVSQLARLAIDEGRYTAITVSGDTPLLRRIHQAFVEAFIRLGGKLVAEHEFASDAAALSGMRKSILQGMPDMAFLALDFAQARLVRPYLGALPIYATSQVHPGHAKPLTGFDLASVRFLDMPWLLQPDHPAVMVYPRPALSDPLDFERLYALGIDAFRLAVALLKGEADVPLDGVTGHLRLGPDQRYVRELTGAQFAEGQLKTFAGKR